MIQREWRPIFLVITTAVLLAACAGVPPDGNNQTESEQQESIQSEVSLQSTEPLSSSRAEAVDGVGGSLSHENLTDVERRFAAGLNQYNNGNYSAAIQTLRSPVFKRAWPELRIRSLKYLAFSYCVTKATAPCKAAFGEILKIDPEFELTEAEAGHPNWGPAFKQIKSETVNNRK